MLDLLKTLKELEQIEMKMAELYQWLAEVFREDSEASDLFTHLWMEEISHQNILQYEGRIVRANPKAFRELNVDIAMLNRTLEAVRNFRQNNPRPDLETALRTALIFEGGAAELYYVTVFKEAAEDFSQFVTNLHAASRTHYDKILRFAMSRKITPPSESVAPRAAVTSTPSTASESPAKAEVRRPN
jgi:rubrerythrin